MGKTWIFSLVKPLFKSFVHDLTGYFFYLIVEFWELLIYFVYKFCFRYMFSKCFLPFCSFSPVLFTLLAQYLSKIKFFTLVKSYFSVFSYMDYTFSVESKKFLPNLGSQRFSYKFASGSLQFQVYIKVYDAFSLNFVYSSRYGLKFLFYIWIFLFVNGYGYIFV